MERGDRASRNGSLAAFLVLEERSELAAGDTLSGCVEVSASGSLQLASVSIGLAFHIGHHEPERMGAAGDWHFERILAQCLDFEHAVRIPFSIRLPFAPISCSDPLPIQPWVVTRVMAADGTESTDGVHVFVRPAPLAELHAGSRGDPYRTSSQKETAPCSMRLEQVAMLLDGRPEAEPVLSALARLNNDLDRLPPSGRVSSPPPIAALGEAIVVSDTSLQADIWWTLCCRHYPKDGSARHGRTVSRIEPNDVDDRRESGGGRRFRLVVPRKGPPSFAIGQESVRWSVVAVSSSPLGTKELEYPLVVLPFVAQRPFEEDVSGTWPRGKLARALRRIRAAKGV